MSTEVVLGGRQETYSNMTETETNDHLFMRVSIIINMPHTRLHVCYWFPEIHIFLFSTQASYHQEVFVK